MGKTSLPRAGLVAGRWPVRFQAGRAAPLSPRSRRARGGTLPPASYDEPAGHPTVYASTPQDDPRTRKAEARAVPDTQAESTTAEGQFNIAERLGDSVAIVSRAEHAPALP